MCQRKVEKSNLFPNFITDTFAHLSPPHLTNTQVAPLGWMDECINEWMKMKTLLSLTVGANTDSQCKL